MASVLNRTTLQYFESVNTPDYPAIDWLANPDLTQVSGFPSKYWIVTGDVVTLMTPAERATVDANELTAMRDAALAQLQQTEDVLRAFMLIVMDEFNAHAAKVNAILTAIDNNATLANIRAAIAAIADLTTRTEQQLRTAIRGRLGT